MRLNEPGESLVVVPVDHARPPRRRHGRARSRPTRSACCSCCCCCASRGCSSSTSPVEPIDDAHRRLLPGAAAGRHPEPRPRAAAPVAAGDGSPRPLAGEAAGAAARPRRDPRAASRTARSAIWCPSTTTTLERDLALALGIPLYGADPAAAVDFGTKTGCRRLFAEEPACAHPLGREDLHGIDERRDALSPDARGAAARAAGDRQAQRRRLGQRQRAGRPARPAGARRRRRARGAAGAPRGDGVRAPGAPTSTRTCSELAERRRHRRGADHRGVELPQPERAAARDAARRGRAALDARPAARRAERAELPRLPVPRRLRLRAGDHGRGDEGRRSGSRARACSGASPSTSSWSATRRGDWTPYAIELNLRKGGTTHPFLTLQFLTDGAYDPVDRALHGAERAREAPRRDRPPRVRAPARRSRSTTSSTSPSATACTSTRPARRASSST